MTTPPEPDDGSRSPAGADLTKHPATGEQPFDPYRFGKPDGPIPAEYAPPGYTGPTVGSTPPATPYGGPPATPYGGQPGPPAPGSTPQNPFDNPPGTPYGPQPPYQYPPAPYGYGTPPPPPYHGYTQPKPGNGKAVAALVLGILSILFCWLSVFDAVFVVLGIIFGAIALTEARRGRAGRGLAMAGLICAIIGALLATIISVRVFSAVDKCGGFDQTDRGAFNQCVRDNF